MKTTLKMCIQRLRYTQEKQQSLAKKSRRDAAKLLAEGKEQKAHYRVESLINDDIHIELLEILELYCELLHARIAILNSIVDEADLIENHVDDGINEAVRAVVYATLHAAEIKELQQAKDLITHKFGLDFLRAIVEDKIGVPEKILTKCSPRLPKEELVELYLSEIARTYEVPYSKLREESEDEDNDESTSSEGDEGGIGEEITNLKDKTSVNTHDGDDNKPIVAVESDAIDDKSHPITVKKPRKNSDTVGAKLKIPDDIKRDVKIVTKKEKVFDTDLDELKKRFAALRR